MKLSIIIPAYNAAKHIGDCLTSLTKQQIMSKDFEIIVVDDGSTDNTAEIVIDFAKHQSNIRLISQQNSGNGAARNEGVKSAQGDYIYFLDADDYISENTLHLIVDIAKKNDLDIVGFKTKNVLDAHHSISEGFVPTTSNLNVITGIEFIATHNYEAEVWWYIIKKTFYFQTGVTFFDRKFVQDSYLTPTLFSQATRVVFLDYDVHRYRISLNSITRKKTIAHLKQHFSDLSFSVQKLYELRNKLLNGGITNKNCITRLHVKQQRYVFIVITRFIKSPLPPKQLSIMLNNFKELEAYPLNLFMSIRDYRSMPYRLLTFIYNRTWLLFPILKLYRFLAPKN